jgi:hypothetical protein
LEKLFSQSAGCFGVCVVDARGFGSLVQSGEPRVQIPILNVSTEKPEFGFKCNMRRKMKVIVLTSSTLRLIWRDTRPLCAESTRREEKVALMRRLLVPARGAR